MATKKISKSGSRPLTSKYPIKYIYETLVFLRDCGFNYSITCKTMGVSHATLKRWVAKYPEAINNQFNNKSLAIIENKSKNKAVEIIELSGKVLVKAINRAGELLEAEEDLNKVSNFIRAATPLASILSEADKEKGNESMSALKETLNKLSNMQRSMSGTNEIQDAEIVN